MKSRALARVNTPDSPLLGNEPYLFSDSWELCKCNHDSDCHHHKNDFESDNRARSEFNSLFDLITERID
jgi:hypothetical protein